MVVSVMVAPPGAATKISMLTQSGEASGGYVGAGSMVVARDTPGAPTFLLPGRAGTEPLR